MSASKSYEIALQAGTVLAFALRPFVERHSPVEGDPQSWLELIARSDFKRLGRYDTEYALDDPRVLLKTIIFHPEQFGDQFTKADIEWANDALKVLNLASSATTSIRSATVESALESMQMLLESVGAMKASFRIEAIADGAYSNFDDVLEGLPETAVLAPIASAAGEESQDVDDAPPVAPESYTTWDAEPTAVETPEPSEPTFEPGQPPESQEASSGSDGEEDAAPRVADLVSMLTDEDEVPHDSSVAVFKQGPVVVEVIYRDALNFALVHNQVSPIVKVTAFHDDQAADHELNEVVISLGDESHRIEADPFRLLALHLPQVDEDRLSVMRQLEGSDLAWHVPARQFADIDEASQTSLRINVTIDGERQTQTHPILLLARDEWYARSIPEILAAFVTPNSKALVPTLQRAGEILREWTGSSDLDGYQSGSERAGQIAQALYVALQELDITYINPPASFETTGQKVRRIEDVISDRLGTCLDLSVMYAAALEQAGLNPVIIRTPGHAFTGFLTVDYQLAELALSDRGMIDNVLRSSMLIPVETTALTSSPAMDFEAAKRATAARFDEDVYYVLDVAAAHRRVRPLPRIRLDASGDVVELVMERDAPTPLPVQTVESAGEPESYRESEEKNLPPRIRKWRQALLDLSLRNPLLKLRKTAMPLAVPERSLATFEDMLASNSELMLRADDDLDELGAAAGYDSARKLGDDALDRILRAEKTVYAGVTTTGYGNRLDKLRREAKSSIDETGANNLFVTLGALSWKTTTDQEALAPLFLLPVRLEGRKKQRFRLSMEEGAKAEPNWCLIEKLRSDFNLTIPVLEEPPEDEHGIDMPRVLKEVRATLARQKVSFHVQPDVRLSMLQFSTVDMWRDMGEHWEEFLENPVVDHLVNSPFDTFSDPAPEPKMGEALEAEAALPVPVDGSQLEAITWASAGRTFVLEGPPGTGKSQTITNMIANSLSLGKKVLFVAEKQAALEVVRTRLDRVGLTPLTLQLHGRNQSVGDVRRQLRESWEAEASGNSTSFRALKDEFRQSIDSLASYPKKLHGTGSQPLSVWQAHQDFIALRRELSTHVSDPSTSELSVPPRVSRSKEATDRAAATARRVEAALDALGSHAPVDDPWLLAGPPQINEADEAGENYTQVLSAVRNFLALHDQLDEQTKSLILRYPKMESWSKLNTWLASVRANQYMPVEHHREVWSRSPRWADEMQSFVTEVNQFIFDYGNLVEAFRPEAWNANPGLLQEKLNEASRKVLGRKRAQEAVQQDIERLLLPASIHLVGDPKVFLNHLDWVQQRARTLDATGERLLPAGIRWTVRNPRTSGLPADVLEKSKAVGEVRQEFSDEDLNAIIRGGMRVDVGQYTHAWNALVQALGATPETLNRWQAGQDLPTAIDHAAPQWRDQAERGRTAGLRRFQKAQAAIDELESQGFATLTADLWHGRASARDLSAKVRLQAAREQLSTQLDETDLARFDPENRSKRVDQYISLSDRVRSNLRTELPAKLLRERGLNKANPTPQQIQLRREIDRKRGGSIRQMIESSEGAVLDLTPCMLMSPASVAKNLPIGSVEFDIVIFDEASQIRVADAIGSMARARSVVIVGDSQQMPPSSMFASSGSDDDESASTEGLVASDQESILSEAVSANLDRKMLTWHYRSADESLIAYSNRRYYQGDLSTFPAPPIDRPGYGIRLVQANGHFDGGDRKATRTNQVEANLIVDDVRRRLEADPEASIGVVTFNIQQQTLIQDLLEDLPDEAIRVAMAREEDPLIVKNLENMQGDERDVILFSLAFSPDPETGRLRLQFGPVSAEGGHRRLNVAITRARREVVIYASFTPEHIDLNRTKSEGMKHLREYLTFAREHSDASSLLSDKHTTELHRQDIAQALRDEGLEVHEEFGMSKFQVDLAVKDPDSEQWFALMLDSPRWAARAIVSDRDSVPAQVLTRMGWAEVLQVWLPSWWMDRDGSLRAIRHKMDQAEERLRETVPSPEEQPRVEDVAETVATVTQPAQQTVNAVQNLVTREEATEVVPEPQQRETVQVTERVQSVAPPATVRSPELVHTEPFHAASKGLVGDRKTLEELSLKANRELVRELLLEVIQAEGPVLADRLTSNIAARFGMQRIKGPRRDQILRCLPSHVTSTKTRLGKCYWPDGADPATWNLVRTTENGGESRPADEIVPQEIENAVMLVLHESNGICTEDHIKRGLNRLFGYNRTGSVIAQAYRAAFESLERQGKIFVVNDLYRLA